MPSLILPKRNLRRPSMLYAVQRLGLTANLKLCLDAGAANSYASGQKWLDLSGNGYDFNRGDGSTSSTFPTFNGTVGALSGSEFWGLDGGDFFTYDSANETWMNALHKDNQSWSLATWFYAPSSLTASIEHFSTTPGGANHGIMARHQSSDRRLAILMSNGSLTFTNPINSTEVTLDAWNFLGLAYQTASGVRTINVHCNSRVEDAVALSGSPAISSSNASATMLIDDDSASPSPSGTRRSKFAMWQGSFLTSAQFASIKSATQHLYA